MKRGLAILLGILVACSGFALAESASAPMARTEQVDADGDGQLDGFACENGRELAAGQPEQLDLDGDDRAEAVEWRANALNEYDEEVLLTVTDGSGEPISWHSGMLFVQRVYAVDVDSDGAIELFVSGDEMSDDYLTFCLRYADGKLEQLPFANVARGDEGEEAYLDAGYGMVTAFGNGLVELTGSQDVLGTYFGSRQFALREGRFELADDGLWHFANDRDDEEMWAYRALRLKRDVAATFAEDGGEAKGTLKAGESIRITASDRTSVTWFVTRDGREGFLAIAPNAEQGWGMRVDGIPEEELFESIPYAD